MAARWWHSRYGGSFLRELVLVVALLLLYKYGRFLTRGHVDTALHNARDVISLERSLGVFSEARLQDLVLRDATLVRFLNVYYLVAHVAVTAAAFLWLYARHPPTYRRFRNVMVVITLWGMVVHLVLPLAPPRMFPNLGFVDTARVFGPASYGAGSPYKGFANQFAAMPSLHFGWALVIAWAVLIATSSKWRFVVLAHPVITLAAIVLTANHYWLDAVVATILFVAALGVDHLIERRRKRKDQSAERGGTPIPAAATARSSIGAPSTYRPAAPRAPAASSATCCRASSTRG
jgi:PAP2 superfamily